MAKWFTCAPMRFKGDASFFWRDTGLLCRALQRLGHESRVILPGPAFEEDLPDILRAASEEMQSPDWWSGLKLDGLIMVAWGRHRDTPIVRAIAASGMPLVLHLDSMGDHFPLFRQVEGLKTYWRAERDTPGNPIGRWIRCFKRLATEAPRNLLRHTYLKYRHLRYASVVTCQTPLSVEGNLRLCRFFGGKRHGVRVRLAGYPISSDCVWDPAIPKARRIIAIGRWDDVRQKRPGTLMRVCAELGRRHPDVGFDIFGRTTADLERWHRELPAGLRERVVVHGRQPGAIVAQAMRAAQISFFPSAFEGGPQALFETLSCGATSVALDSPFLPGHRWAAEQGHAELAGRDTTEAYLDALDRALSKWERGQYDPASISRFWSQWTLVENVVRTMIEGAQEESR